MASKVKSDIKTPVLKGQEAEEKILEYLKQMNRPYGAVDVAANLKGAVPKTATQKILVALAEKGDLVQKIYGKTTFFVYDQSKINSLPKEKIDELKAEVNGVEEENKLLMAEVKSLTTDLTKIKSTPTDEEIEAQISSVKASIEQISKSLQPLRSGAPPISAEERNQIYADWARWRADWVRRRKIFATFWEIVSDPIPPQDANDLEENLGIERDTPEHLALEQSTFCQPLNPLKRKRS
ncbi:TBPIP-domain-containing protein [Crepidotus variabilis]|uniref:TBPIP-domain-containing protein n=1 Tax=Crepidotus variabilis TaxID=179855 RepID=A0A9P6EG52_9AGAR|nr:TBPIP-domain-containing protein [Crepidotus variabilis]